MVMGPVNHPASLIQWVPVISPFPFIEKVPAQTGESSSSGLRGSMAVTPVRTTVGLSRTKVCIPTRTPLTSVMALRGPVLPGSGRFQPRARRRPSADSLAGSKFACSTVNRPSDFF